MIDISRIIQLVDIAEEFGSQGLLSRPELACNLNKYGKLFEDSSDKDSSDEESSSKEQAGDCKRKAETSHTNKKERRIRASGKTALGLAVTEKRIKTVASLLEAKADINQFDKKFRSALHYAVLENSLEIAALLLSQGANYEVGLHDTSPLHTAARLGFIKLMHLLLEHKADINFVRSGSTPLIAAIRFLKKNWQEGIRFSDRSEHQNYITGRHQTVEALLAAKADIRIKDSNDKTPMYHAADEEAADVISLLKAYGAAMDTEDVGVCLSRLLHLKNPRISKFKFEKDEPSKDEIQENWEETILALLTPDTINVKFRINTRSYYFEEETALYMATRLGATRLMSLLIDKKADVNLPCHYDRETALVVAVKENNPDCTKILLAAKAAVNHKCRSDNRTPLHIALGRDLRFYEKLKNSEPALSNRIACVTALLQAKADVHLKADGYNALHIALEHEQPQLVSLLCNEKADVYCENKHGETPMQLAIQHRNLDCVKALIAAKTSIHSGDVLGRTPLHFAAKYHMPEAIRLFCTKDGLRINSKGDKKAKHFSPCTPLSAALESLPQLDPMTPLASFDHVNAYATIYRLLELKASFGSDRKGESYLFGVIRSNHADLLRVLVSRIKKLVNERNYEGTTPVHFAIRYDHDICLQVLVESKADLSLKPTNKGYKDMTLIHFAAVMNAGKCIPRLLAYGESLEAPYTYYTDTKDTFIYTPIQTAVKYGRLDSYRSLLQAKANLSASNRRDGYTLFDLAVMYGNAEIIPWLLEQGFKVNAKHEESGDTPLILAAHGDWLKVTQMLLDTKANIHDVDKKGNTALHWAAGQGAYALIPMLIAYGADPNLLNDAGKSPLMLAKAGHTAELLKIIEVVQPCFDPGHLQVLADYIEEEYLVERLGDHLLTDRRDEVLLNLIRAAINKSFDLIFKVALAKLESVQAELKLSAEENAQENEKRKKLLKDTMENLLARNYLAARSEVTFWKPYIEVLLNQCEGAKEGIEVLPEEFPNKHLNRLCVDYYPGFSLSIKGFYVQPHMIENDPNAVFTQRNALARHNTLIKRRVDWLLPELDKRYKSFEEQSKMLARYAPLEKASFLDAEHKRSKDKGDCKELQKAIKPSVSLQMLNEPQPMEISAGSLLFAFLDHKPKPAVYPRSSMRPKS